MNACGCPGSGTMAHVRGCSLHPEAMTATIPRVPRPRGELTDAQKKRLMTLDFKRVSADIDYRSAVVDVLNAGASFAELAKHTGLSTNTLQRWKREASA